MSRVRLDDAFPLPFACPLATRSAVRSNTLYPVGLTRDQVVEAYWRVRRWKITVNVVASDPDLRSKGLLITGLRGTGYADVGYTLPYGSNFYPPAPTSERGLIAPPCSTIANVSLEGGDNGSNTFNLFIRQPRRGWIAPAVRCHGLWYPALSFGSTIYGSIYAPDPDAVNGGVNATILGVSIASGYTPQQVNNGDGSMETVTFAGTLVIEPDKYWEYRGADGAALYDRDTGAQLLDPLSAAYP